MTPENKKTAFVNKPGENVGTIWGKKLTYKINIKSIYLQNQKENQKGNDYPVYSKTDK